MKELKLANSKQSDVDAFMAEILLLESLPVHKNLVRFLFHHKSSDRVRIFMRRYESTLDTWLLVSSDKSHPSSPRAHSNHMMTGAWQERRALGPFSGGQLFA